MELTGLTHRLVYGGNTYVIDEPQGFDKFTVKIKRHEFHGISAQFSEQTLGFYGDAAHVIKTAYTTDIDSIVSYTVRDRSNTLVYEGVVDLSTFVQRTGRYEIVECKVAEINAKTIFNNRIDTPVNLIHPVSLDGLDVGDANWQNIHIPIKHLPYTNLSTRDADFSVVDRPYYQTIRWSYYSMWKMGENSINEFGEFSGIIQESRYLEAGTDDKNDWPIDPQYYTNADFISQFGTTTARVSFLFKVRVSIDGGHNDRTSANLKMRLIIKNTNGAELQSEYVTQQMVLGDTYELSLFLEGELSANDGIRFFTEVADTMADNYDYGVRIAFDVMQGSYIKMLMYDNIEETTPVRANMIFVADAAQIISHAISEMELAVKSDWYQYPDSAWASTTGNYGGGSLKALTDGYRIRGITPDGTERNMPLSFKDLVTSLNALDCVGWGFSNENGYTYIRLERWNWFYKSNVLLSINNPSEITRTFVGDGVITKFTIGYKKYETNDAFNSIDSIHGERTFTSLIKAVANEKTALCDFIADNYAIEKTRRAKTQLDSTKEFSYDENIFVFELAEKDIPRLSDIGHLYDIPSNIRKYVTDATGIARPSELLNPTLSPRHCASRWRDYMFATQSTSNLKFQSGTINYTAGFTAYQPAAGYTFLANFAEDANGYQAENDDITNSRAIFLNETLEVEYPISAGQYAAVIANPYGLVLLNGRPCWIKEMIYTLVTGLAKFTLIPSRHGSVTDTFLEELVNN